MDPLIERAKSGDRAALEELLERVAPSIHRFGLRMCRNEHDAEDVLQDTLENVARHLGEFEGRSSLSSWVFALTRSACTRRRRGLKNRPMESDAHLAEEPDRTPSPESRAGDAELARALSRALDSLPVDYREVILLRDVEGLDANEAASALGVSVDALKSRLHRARGALRAALRPFLEEGAPLPAPGCPDVMNLWSRKLEGDLSQEDCASMERHLLSCASCGAACDALKRALLACRRSATTEVPKAVQDRVRAAMRTLAGPAR